MNNDWEHTIFGQIILGIGSFFFLFSMFIHDGWCNWIKTSYPTLASILLNNQNKHHKE